MGVPCPMGVHSRYMYLFQYLDYYGSAWLVFTITIFCRKITVNEKSVDPDQTLSSAASDLGVHCLPSTLLLDARFGWVQLI